MSVNGGPNISENGLIFSLDAADRTSYPGTGTAWNDLVGNNNGTLTNGPTFNSGNKGSIVFDGVNDYVSLSDVSLNMSTPWTISFWSFLINPLTPYPEVITFKTNQTYPFEIAFSNVSSYLGVGFGSPNTVQRKTDISLSNYTNKWVFITLTYVGSNPNNANSYVLYDMGLNVTTVQAGAYGVISNESVLCGGTSATHHWFRGNLGLTQLYNRALSSQEVLQNYNNTKSRFGL
jgi:hypothetical protein